MKYIFLFGLFFFLPFSVQSEINTSTRLFSDAEIKLLQELDNRRVELDRREQALELRERLVDLTESRLLERLAQLQSLEGRLDGLLKDLSDKEEAELAQLAKIYESMKPVAAADVLNKLDNAIVYDLFKRMKNKKTAKIMEKMTKPKARFISEMLAKKRDLPTFFGENDG